MARRKPPAVHGLAIVDKPAGVTSHDVVAQLRRRFGEQRVGHAGTLDPDATGLLLVGVGQVTRLLRFIGEGRKSYVGEVVFGVETSTLDAAGEVTATYEMDVDLAAARAAARSLTGEILQVPPMVSALKVGGRRLHELAREGIEVDRAPRPVTVYRLDLAPGDEDTVLRIEVDCSGGTYIRSIAADLGRLLGGGAHLRNLRRVAIGPFRIAEAAPPEECVLLPPVEAMRGHTIVAVDEATVALVAQGRVLDPFPGSAPWVLLGPDGTLLAVYEPFAGGRAKPAVVLAGGSGQ